MYRGRRDRSCVLIHHYGPAAGSGLVIREKWHGKIPKNHYVTFTFCRAVPQFGAISYPFRHLNPAAGFFIQVSRNNTVSGAFAYGSQSAGYDVDKRDG